MPHNNPTQPQQAVSKANYTDDEIDLFELLEDVKNKWRWVVASFVACTAVAVIYALLAQPVYQAELVFRPSTNTDLYELNRPQLKELLGQIEEKVNPATGEPIKIYTDFIDSAIAYEQFRARVMSSSSLRDFYKQLLQENISEVNSFLVRENLDEEQNTLKFFELFSLEDPKKGALDVYFKLKFNFVDAQLTANLLNKYADFVMVRYLTEKRRTAEGRIQGQIDLWTNQAEELRSSYYTNKTQRLLALKEAVAIAKSINQQQPIYDGERVTLGVAPPLYMMGVKALTAEMKQLEQRSEGNEDDYISGLTELLNKIKHANSIVIDWEEVELIDLDQNAIKPLSPIKPKKKLIVVIGAFMGGLLGVFLALVVAAWQRRNKTQV